MPDNLTLEQRRRAMSSVKQKDTDIEVAIRSALHKRGYRFRKHVITLPGKPDIVFPSQKLVVFVDGNFWHGYRFPDWAHKVSPFWQQKILRNRMRDQKNFRLLRRQGWRVMRLWKHEINGDLDRCLDRICTLLETSRQGDDRTARRPGFP